MSRPRTVETEQILRDLLSGLTPKEIAFSLGRAPCTVSKTAWNHGIRKQYVTESEFRQILSQRKTT